MPALRASQRPVCDDLHESKLRVGRHDDNTRNEPAPYFRACSIEPRYHRNTERTVPLLQPAESVRQLARNVKEKNEMSDPTQAPALDLDAFLITADLLERGHDCHDDPKRAKWCVSDPCRTLTTARQLRALVAEVRRLRAREAKLRELHAPVPIYQECGHEHEEAEPGKVFVSTIGLTCNYRYDVCRACCISPSAQYEDEPFREICEEHRHRPGTPICKTREILDA